MSGQAAPPTVDDLRKAIADLNKRIGDNTKALTEFQAQVKADNIKLNNQIKQKELMIQIIETTANDADFADELSKLALKK